MGLFGTSSEEARMKKARVLLQKGRGCRDYNPKKAWKYYQEAAELGFDEAMVQLAEEYDRGKLVEPDKKKSLYWYEKAAEKGNRGAQSWLGGRLLDGTYGVKDEQKAFFWTQKAAEQWNYDAITRCGEMYLKGIGTEVDYKKALHWSEINADRDYPSASAQFYCGEIYYNGLGMVPDKAKGLYYYRQAAENGSGFATNKCGEIFAEEEDEYVGYADWDKEPVWLPDGEKGEELRQKYEINLKYRKARHLCSSERYQDAASLLTEICESHGDACPDAQAELGRLYLVGQGVAEDECMGMRLVEKSIKNGSTDGMSIYVSHIKSKINCTWEQYDLAMKCAKILDASSSVFHKVATMEQKAVEIQEREALEATARAGDLEAQLQCGKLFDCEDSVSTCLEWYRMAAEQGDAFAQEQCGRLYKAMHDPAQSMFWYEKAAGQGRAEAQYRMGRIYDNRENEKEKAFAWYHKAAVQGHAKAQKECGLMCAYGMGTDRDLKESLRWLEAAADQGDNDIQETCARHTVDETRRLYWYERASLPGTVYTLYLREQMREGHRGNTVQVLNWLKQDGLRGNAEILERCGDIYYFGEGVPVDYPNALRFYEKAAELGCARSQYACGLMYQMGKGTSVDHKKAFYWTSKSAEQDYAEAQCKLGYMYKNGEGTEADRSEAFFWYKKAAEQGDAMAQYNLAAEYYNRHNDSECVADQIRAFSWCLKAAKGGFAKAQYLCGMWYHEGYGVERNTKEDIKWFEKAAQAGNVEAQRKCVELYEHDASFFPDAEKYRKKAEYWREILDNNPQNK